MLSWHFPSPGGFELGRFPPPAASPAGERGYGLCSAHPAGRREPRRVFVCCLCRIPAFLPLFTHLLPGRAQTPQRAFGAPHFPPPPPLLPEPRALAGTGRAEGGSEKPASEGLQKYVGVVVGQPAQPSADLLSVEALFRAWRCRTLLQRARGCPPLAVSQQLCCCTPTGPGSQPPPRHGGCPTEGQKHREPTPCAFNPRAQHAVTSSCKILGTRAKAAGR